MLPLHIAANAPKASGMEAIRKMMTEMFAMPGFALKWQPTNIETGHSGDIGYSLGTYEFSANDPNRKYLTIWKKQANGSWKVAIDTFNSDAPMPPSPSK